MKLSIYESRFDCYWTSGSVTFFLSGIFIIRRAWGSLELWSLWSGHSNRAGNLFTECLWQTGSSFPFTFPALLRSVNSFCLLVCLISSLLTPNTQSEAPEGDNILSKDFHYRALWEQLTTLCSYLLTLLSNLRYCWMGKLLVAEKRWWEPPVSQCWGRPGGCSGMEAAEAGNHSSSWCI